MLNATESRRGMDRWFPQISLVALVLVCTGLPTWSVSQTIKSVPISTGGPISRPPTIPLKSPRPAEGTDSSEMWNTDRAAADNSPVASFIDTLSTADVAIEVILGQSRLMTVKSDIAGPEGTAVIAVGDPSVLSFEVMPNPRVIRLTGKRAGITDLSITTSDGQTYIFEAQVVYDLDLLRAQLKQAFPDAIIRLAQMREHLVVEGQARSPRQVSQILQSIEAYVASVATTSVGGGGSTASSEDPQGNRGPGGTRSDKETADSEGDQPASNEIAAEAESEIRGGGGGGGGIPPQVINLLRVPGVHQVMLQVRIAELNRTGIREIGADILGVDPSTGNILGTQIGGAAIGALGALGLGGLTGAATGDASGSTTAFGIFPSGDFEILLRALRRNQLLSILAEPNLMAMSGEEASFLAGGEFPVPVPQSSGGLGTNTITIEWKEFGVLLDFLPTVLDDETIRLKVSPEVSTIDESLGIVLEGFRVPGVNTRRASTTVELSQGQTLAMAGLLTVAIEGNTSRIPGLGDLPYIGMMFSNTSHKRVEKELLVLVTPYLVSPMEPEQVAPLPGEDLKDPNDLEFYLMNRIEGRTGREHRSTTTWDDPLGLVDLMKLERSHVCGPVGFSE
jgi:pilus assembly protein CpaC